MSGFDGFYLRMAELAARVPEAGKAAVAAALVPIYEKSQELVPVATGTLKASGRITDPVIDGGVISAAVTYGNEQTMTPWHGGTGYEIFVEYSTRNMPAQPYLTPATLESAGEIPPLMAEAFTASMVGAGT